MALDPTPGRRVPKVKVPTSFTGKTLTAPPPAKKTPPPIRPRPDAADRNAAARKRNTARGAAPSGGLGRKETADLERVSKSVTKPVGPQVAALQTHLAKQGYSVRVDGILGPETLGAWQLASGAAVKQKKAELSARVEKVLRNPIKATNAEKVKLFGFLGAQAIDDAVATQQLARRAAYERALEEDRDDRSRLQRVWDYKASDLANDLGEVGKAIGKAGASRVLEAAWEGDEGPNPLKLTPELQGALAGSKAGVDILAGFTVGADLAHMLSGLPHSKAGLGIDLALLPMVAVAKPIKAARAGAAAVKATKKGKEAAGEAFDATYEGASVLQARRARRQALKIGKKITEQHVKENGLNAAHKRALKGYADAAFAHATRKAELQEQGLAKKDLDKALAPLSEARARAKSAELYQRLRATSDAERLTPDDPRYAARRQMSEQLVKAYKGRQGALPDKATPAMLEDVFAFLDEMTLDGEAGRMWYENSAEAIKAFTGGDLVKAERFAQLLAIYSPQQPIIGNTSLAIRAWNEFNSTGEISTGQDWQKDAASSVLRGEGDWEGRKTNNFYVNFLEDINKAKYDELVATGEIRGDGVTIDLWMARVFGYGKDEVAEGRYDVMESIVKLLAAERGWKPKQVQAAIWTAIKDASDDVSANIDFSSGIERHFGQINYSVAPRGLRDDGFAAAYDSWPDEIKGFFATANAKLVDEFLADIGALAEPSALGPGIYLGPGGLEVDEGAFARVATSAAPRDSAVKYSLHPTERAQMQKASAAIGLALRADKVSWIRPSVTTVKGDMDTLHIGVGREVTEAEHDSLFRRLNPGDSERFTIQRGADGGIIIRNKGGIANYSRFSGDETFHRSVDEALSEVFGDTDVAITTYASDGDVVESGSYGDLLAAGDGEGSGAAVRFGQAADRLAADAAEPRVRFLDAVDRAAAAGQLEGVAPSIRFDPPLSAVEADQVEGAKTWLAQIDGFVRSLAPTGGVGSGVVPGLNRLENVELRPAKEGLAGRYEPRTLKTGDLTQQLPRARSRLTQRGIEDPADFISRYLDSTVVYETPGAWVMTSSARVAKHAGRAVRKDQGRRLARVAREMEVIGSIKEGSVEDVAAFWYAQLPTAWRNVDGLEMIKQTQTEELHFLVDGGALASLDSQEKAVRARQIELREDPDATKGEAMGLVQELDDIRQLRSSIDRSVKEVSASIAMLDKVIAANPQIPDEVFDAMARLSADRRRILVDAGRLNPENARLREGLLARHLGLEEDGTEIYVGHRLPRAGRGRGTFQASGGVGRVASPAGLSENKMILARTGRLRPSTRVAAEDWQASTVFDDAMQARETLGKMGRPYRPGEPIPAGMALVNPKGRVIPKHWRPDELSQFTEDADDIRELRAAAEEILSGFLATSSGSRTDMLLRIVEDQAPEVLEGRRLTSVEDFKEMLLDAQARGVQWHELRVVDQKLVDRYYKQFRTSSARSTPWVAYDMAIDAVATSLIFARIGYIPKNVVQNLIVALPHQGIFFPMNAARAGQVIADDELRALFTAEIGFSSASGALQAETTARNAMGKALHKVQGFVGSIADNPARMSAFLHEAAAEGVIGKYSVILTDKDREALVQLLKNPKHRDLLNDISMRSNEAMADFSRLTPDQARAARRLLIIPGWLMAGTRYPFHFAATHPVRSALIAYAAMGEPYAPEELRFNEPVTHYLEGKRYLRGIDTPWGRIRTSSLNPVSMPWEMYLGAAGSIKGKKSPFDYETETVFDLVNPVLSSAIRALQGEQAFDYSIIKRFFPNVDLARAMVDPQESPSYAEDDDRIWRFLREVGVVPIPINDPEEEGGYEVPRSSSVPPGLRPPPGRPGGSGPPSLRPPGS